MTIFGPKYEIGRMVISEIIQKDEIIIGEIVAGAKTLFERYGLKKTTMEDIAREAGKSKSSLYYYFQSKYEIFEAVVEQEINHLFNTAEKAIEKVPTAKDKLKAYSEVRLCKISKSGNLSQVIKNDLMDNMDVILKMKKKHESRQVKMVRDIIAQGVKSGEFKKIGNSEIDLLSLLFTAAFTGISLPLCGEHKFPDLTQKVDVIVDVLIHGIGK